MYSTTQGVVKYNDQGVEYPSGYSNNGVWEEPHGSNYMPKRDSSGGVWEKPHGFTHQNQEYPSEREWHRRQEEKRRMMTEDSQRWSPERYDNSQFERDQQEQQAVRMNRGTGTAGCD